MPSAIEKAAGACALCYGTQSETFLRFALVMAAC
jgi:hypothetical protein